MPTGNRIPAAEALEVVILGSFNPAIFQPEWFLRQSLVAEEDVKKAVDEGHVKAVTTEATEIQIAGMKLLCLNERLSLGISNVSYSARMQDFVLHIFSLLPHTPVNACGINAHLHYSMSGEVDYWNKIGHTLAPKELIWNDLLTSPGMLALAINSPRTGDFPGQTNVRVEPSHNFPPGLFVSVNYHYPIPKENAKVETTDFLIKFLKSEWNSAAELSRRVADQIFKKIRPDNE